MVMPRGIALPGNDWSLLDGRRPASAPSVSVVVAHFEQQTQLDRTLLALARQDHPADRLEIIVVDDGSARPPTVADGIRLIVQENRGFRLAAARNTGAAVASGEILCFLDADTVPERTYVRELTRLPALAPDVVTVGRRRHADLASLPTMAVVDDDAAIAELPGPRWLEEAYRRSHDLLDVDDRSYRFVIGAVIATSRSLFDDAGGFDETFDSYGGEDWEWAYRAWLAGALFAHVPTAVAWHDGPEWAARIEATIEQKNREALRLAELIPVPGSAFHGLEGAYVDIVITLPDEAVMAIASKTRDCVPWLIAKDSLVAELPLAAFPGDPRRLDRSRIRIDVLQPLRIEEGALRGVIDRVARQGLSSVCIVDADDRELCLVTALRAERRAARWRRQDLFPAGRSKFQGIDPVPSIVELEAYLGGWG